MSTWEIIESSVYGAWFDRLSEQEQDELIGRLELLRAHGPALGRPVVDRIQGSRIHNLKELRARHRRVVLRVLFVFDPRRRAVLLVGGDKAGGGDQPAQWNRWYQRAVPLAEAIYDEYLRREGLGAEERDND